jgi:hypothetical protein
MNHYCLGTITFLAGSIVNPADYISSFLRSQVLTKATQADSAPSSKIP